MVPNHARYQLRYASIWLLSFILQVVGYTHVLAIGKGIRWLGHRLPLPYAALGCTAKPHITVFALRHKLSQCLHMVLYIYFTCPSINYCHTR